MFKKRCSGAIPAGVVVACAAAGVCAGPPVFQGLEAAGGNDLGGSANGVSPDGRVVVGGSGSAPGHVATRW